MNWRVAAVFAAMAVAVARPAWAVIVAGDYATTSDANVNVTPPTDDPGWHNVGSVGSGSAIYLGNDWVLSANHTTLGATAFTFFDTNSSQFVTGSYQIVPNSGVVLTNPSGTGAGHNSDLVMYKIDPSSSPYGAPNLPQPILPPSAPTSGGTVVGIGRGIDRQATQTYWDNSQPVWQTLPNPPASHTGYIVNGPQTMRWGNNQIDQLNVSYNAGTNSQPIYIQAFTTKFDQFKPQSGGTALASEFQATVGDSGGGAFQKLGNLWVLNGMIDAVTLMQGQPYPSDSTPNAPFTAVFDNSTIIADLSVYKSQILALDPLTGDANGDGLVNGLDISLVASKWLTAGPSGDVNHDGIVNGLDIALVASHWTGTPGNGGASVATVPEPSTLALAIAVVGLLLLRSMHLPLQRPIALAFVVLMIGGYWCPAAADEKRYVIIHADDAGMSHSVNAATIQAMEQGIVSSASIMVPCPWFKEIAAYAKAHPEKDFGIHLTLNSEWKDYRWGPVASCEQVPSLIDSEGYLWGGVQDIVSSAKAAEVEVELRAQIKRALEFGVPVTHLDTHMGAVVSRPDLIEIYVKLGVEFNVPVFFIRGLNVGIAANNPQVRSRGVELIKLLDDHHLPVLDFMTQYYTGEPYDTKKRMYLEAIEQTKPGVRYLIIHCGYNNEELQAISSSAQLRDNDRRVFTDPEVIEAVKKSGVEVVSWKQLREKIGKPSAATEANDR